jgi:hypothetical protein
MTEVLGARQRWLERLDLCTPGTTGRDAVGATSPALRGRQARATPAAPEALVGGLRERIRCPRECADSVRRRRGIRHPGRGPPFGGLGPWRLRHSLVWSRRATSTASRIAPAGIAFAIEIQELRGPTPRPRTRDSHVAASTTPPSVAHRRPPRPLHRIRIPGDRRAAHRTVPDAARRPTRDRGCGMRCSTSMGWLGTHRPSRLYPAKRGEQ